MNENYQKEELEIDLIDYFKVIWRRRWSFLIVFVIVLVLTVVITILTPKTYQSTALVKQGETTKLSVLAINSLLKQEKIFKELVKKLDWPESATSDLAKKFKITEKDELIEISATERTPEGAKKIAEVISNFIVDYQNKRKVDLEFNLKAELSLLNEQIKKYEKEINELETKINALSKTNSQTQGLIIAIYINAKENLELKKDELARELNQKQQQLNSLTNETKIESPAFLPSSPIKPNKVLNLVIGFILGIFIGLFWIFVTEYFSK